MQSIRWNRNDKTDPFRELLRQKQELRRQREEVVKVLYEFIAEFEGRPVEKPELGFPFNLIVRSVYKALGAIESVIRRTVAAFVK